MGSLISEIYPNLDTLRQIIQVFNEEEMIYQFGVKKYRIDLYFPKYKLAIE